LVLAWLQPLSDQYHVYGVNCFRDVEQQRLTRLWSYHDWQRCEISLELLKCIFSFLCSDEGPELLQKLEEQESSIKQSTDKLA
jgi:hypothetical protein